MRKWCFYTLPLVSAPSAMDSSQAIDTTRQLLAQAVGRQMVADVPVGAFLSGGLDSSGIVHFARQYAPDTKSKSARICGSSSKPCSITSTSPRQIQRT